MIPAQQHACPETILEGFGIPPCQRIGALNNILPRSTKKLETALGWTDGWRWRKKQHVPERSLVTAETGTWHGCWRTKQLTRFMMSVILEHQICSLTLTNTFWGPCVGKGKSKYLWVLEVNQSALTLMPSYRLVEESLQCFQEPLYCNSEQFMSGYTAPSTVVIKLLPEQYRHLTAEYIKSMLDCVIPSAAL